MNIKIIGIELDIHFKKIHSVRIHLLQNQIIKKDENKFEAVN